MTLTRRQLLQTETLGMSTALLSPRVRSTMAEISTVRAAFLHLAPHSGDLAYNRYLVERAVTTAAGLGARWVLTPELCVCGYTFTDQIGTDWIMPQPDPWMTAVCQLASQLHVPIFLSHKVRKVLDVDAEEGFRTLRVPRLCDGAFVAMVCGYALSQDVILPFFPALGNPHRLYRAQTTHDVRLGQIPSYTPGWLERSCPALRVRSLPE